MRKLLSSILSVSCLLMMSAPAVYADAKIKESVDTTTVINPDGTQSSVTQNKQEVTNVSNGVQRTEINETTTVIPPNGVPQSTEKQKVIIAPADEPLVMDPDEEDD